MTRPHCPKCERLAVIVDSRKSDDGLRIQRLGCRRCGCYSLGADVVSATVKRTRTVISRLLRTPSGRFAKAG